MLVCLGKPHPPKKNLWDQVQYLPQNPWGQGTKEPDKMDKIMHQIYKAQPLFPRAPTRTSTSLLLCPWNAIPTGAKEANTMHYKIGIAIVSMLRWLQHVEKWWKNYMHQMCRVY